MKHFPLLFGFRDRVAGNGFVAGVAMNGRALLIHEREDEFDMHGVTPGGVTGTGPDLGRAYTDFREGYRSVLFDLAAEAKDFDAFKVGVEEFFNEHSPELLREWEAAREEVRAGNVDLQGFRKVADPAAPTVEVERLKQPKPANNELDVPIAIADAA